MVTSNKSEVTKIYNKVDAFLNKLTVGDIAVIPSINSNQLLIGEISSDVYEFYKSSRDNDFSDNILANSAAPSTSIVSNDNLGKIYFSGDDDYTRCEHVKRRNVKWIKMLEKSKLDIYLRNSIKPHQAISPLNAFAGIINRSLYDVYVTDHAMHSMIRTRQTGDISLGDLKKLVDFIYDSFAILLKDDAGAEIISQNDIKIKLNIQSHGLVEVIAVGVIAPLVLSYVYAFIHNAKYGGNLKFKAEVLGAKVELEWETQGKNPKEIELLRTQLDFKQEQIDAMYEKYSEIESLDPLLPNVDFIENVSESVDDPKL